MIEETPRQQSKIGRFLSRPATVWTALGLLVLFVGIVAPPDWFKKAQEKLDNRNQTTAEIVFSEKLETFDKKIESGNKLQRKKLQQLKPYIVLRRILRAGKMNGDQLQKAQTIVSSALNNRPQKALERLPDKISGQFPRIDSKKLSKELAKLQKQLKRSEPVPSNQTQF